MFWGTAPHARGPLFEGGADEVRVGNSPARAGTTARNRTRAWAGREQPRTRGDHTYSTKPEQSKEGTAPHARGPLSVSGGWDGTAATGLDGGSSHSHDSNAFAPTWINLNNIEFFLD